MRSLLLLADCLAFCGVQAYAQEHPADQFYDPQAMQAARDALYSDHGGSLNWMFLGERFEYQSGEGDPEFVWEAQGWYGGDMQKLWIKSDAEYGNDDGRFETLELQALYSRAIQPFWDLQVGLRHDIRPSPARSHAVIGLMGTAPYWFELDSALFVSERGDVSLRLEAEYEFRLSQRLMLQPRLEVNAALSDDEVIELGSGLSELELELRLRYAVTRQIAPYIGLSWSRTSGNTVDFIGRDRRLSIAAGVRFWL